MHFISNLFILYVACSAVWQLIYKNPLLVASGAGFFYYIISMLTIQKQPLFGAHENTASEMARMVEQYAHRLPGIHQATAKEWYNKIKALHYKRDPKGMEWVTNPIITINPNYEGFRDCDDKSILMASWAFVHKKPFRFVAGAKKGQNLHHVWPEIAINRRNFISFDATFPKKYYIGNNGIWNHRKVLYMYLGTLEGENLEGFAQIASGLLSNPDAVKFLKRKGNQAKNKVTGFVKRKILKQKPKAVKKKLPAPSKKEQLKNVMVIPRQRLNTGMPAWVLPAAAVGAGLYLLRK